MDQSQPPFSGFGPARDALTQRGTEPGLPPVDAEIFAPEPGTGRRFRTALGRFATGVAVITTRTGAGPIGITANSFASVSLDPPLVLWSPARASLRFAAFAECSHMAIHVLAADQLALAQHFASRAVPAGLEQCPCGIGGVPLLPDVLTRLECAVEAVYPGGDHAIVLGRVLRVESRPGRPLVFHDGAYTVLAGQ